MIDIIIPAYNAHEWIGNLLKSIEKQSIKDKLYITIIDDGSLKKYDEVLEKLKLTLNINIIRNSFNRGVAYSRKLGFKKTNNKYLMFLDADDLLVNNKVLEEMYDIVKDNPDANLVCAKEVNNGYCRLHEYHLVGKLLKREIIQKYNIKFPKLANEEDIAFMMTYQTVINAKGIYFIDKLFYKYNHVNPNSITTKYNFLINYDYKEFFKAVDFSYTYAQKYNKYEFFKVNILNIFSNIAKLYSVNVNKENKNKKVEEIFLKRCQEFYNKYKLYLDMEIKRDKIDEKDCFIIKWFIDFLKIK